MVRFLYKIKTNNKKINTITKVILDPITLPPIKSHSGYIATCSPSGSTINFTPDTSFTITLEPEFIM